ncbi:MTH938/NDUFAF3 family protein [archaeon]|nr:MTH938/NDUFAF3 family protein [archaeon]
MIKLFGWSSLGRVKYDTEVYEEDFVVSTFQEVFPREIEDDAHFITEEELERSVDDKTKIIMIGTGDYGVLKVSKEAKRYCKKNKFDLIVKKTPDIIQEYNKKMKRKGRKPSVTAIIHVRC